MLGFWWLGVGKKSQNPMEESSDQEFHTNSDHQNPLNDAPSQNPQSEKTLEEFAKPQSGPMIGDGGAPGKKPGEEEDLECQNALDDEIRQVIYKESLNEAVMNLALEGEQRNGHGWDGESSNFGGMGMEGVGFGRGVNGAVWEGSDWDRSGNFGDMQGQYGSDGAAGEQEEEEGFNGAEENSGFGGSRNYSKHLFQYPLRIDAEDCAFYMKTGNCKFGMNCKFNHPQKRRNQFLQAARDRSKPRAEDSERTSQTECKYYLTSGGCKFGSACKYNHSREKSAVSPAAPAVEFNFLGLPIRLGEKECPYYMRNGSCKYGTNCKFNHPDPTPAAANDPPSGYGNIGPVKLHGAAQSVDMSWTSSVTLPQSPGVPSIPDWNGYQPMSYSTSERSLPTPPAFAMNNPSIEVNLYAHHQQQMPVDEFPQRPGEPDCSYFLRTGDCKYKANCRFHHPKLQNCNPTPCALSDKGLPLRPDQSICSFYNRYGICKFGPACKFDHPENWGKSLSSDGVGMPRSEMQAGFF